MTVFLRSRLLSAHGVPHGFSVRTGGVSRAPFDSLNLGGAVGDEPAAVRDNHARLLAAVGVERAHFTRVKQVHGARVRGRPVPAEVRGRFRGAPVAATPFPGASAVPRTVRGGGGPRRRSPAGGGAHQRAPGGCQNGSDGHGGEDAPHGPLSP